MTVSSMSETMPKSISGSTMKTSADTSGDPFERSRIVFQPGGRLTSSTTSMMPLSPATTSYADPSISTSTWACSTQTLVKLRQPRIPAGSDWPARTVCSGASRTRPSTRIHVVEP